MRLLDEDNDTAIHRLTMLLTRAEASELRDALDAILADASRHEHVPDRGFEREITVAVYDPADVSPFNERSQRLIETGG